MIVRTGNDFSHAKGHFASIVPVLVKGRTPNNVEKPHPKHNTTALSLSLSLYIYIYKIYSIDIYIRYISVTRTYIKSEFVPVEK